MQALEDALRFLKLQMITNLGTGEISIFGGAGLSGAKYEDFRNLCEKDYVSAPPKLWEEREKLRYDSLKIPAISPLFPPSYIYIGYLCKMGLLKSIITPNWDLFINRAIRMGQKKILLNPCGKSENEIEDYGGFISLEKYKGEEEFVHLWKIHGSLDYIYFPCCYSIRGAPPFELGYPDKKMFHLECGKIEGYKHYIKDRDEKATHFRSIVTPAISDLMEEAKIILIIGFKGGEGDEEIVDKILEIANTKKHIVFNINRASWEGVGKNKLWDGLKEIDPRLTIKMDCSKALRYILEKILNVDSNEIELFTITEGLKV